MKRWENPVIQNFKARIPRAQYRQRQYRVMTFLGSPATRFLLLLLAGACSGTAGPCGGRFTGPRGVLATPGFPGPFPVPARCRWLIDASEPLLALGGSGAVVVYLTQLYAARGLRMTEYAYYGSAESRLGGRLLLEVGEQSELLAIGPQVRSGMPYLLLELDLEDLEGGQLRVRDRLLDVYGLNVTYEVTGESRPRNDSCTAEMCSFNGDCRVSKDFREFRCDCDRGYSGQDCSRGPLCSGQSCQNSGTCRHVGAAGVRCECPPGFRGDFCEIAPEPPPRGCNSSAESCLEDCGTSWLRQQHLPSSTRHPPDPIGPCGACGKSSGSLRQSRRDPVRTGETLECRLMGSANSTQSVIQQQQHPSRRRDPPAERQLNRTALEARLVKLISKSFQEANISSIDDFRILNVTPGLEVHFYLSVPTDQVSTIKESINKLSSRRRFVDFFQAVPSLSCRRRRVLEAQGLKLNSDRGPLIEIGEEIELTCSAIGTQSIRFLWYKNSVLIDVNKSRSKYNKTLDVHSATLTIKSADHLDAGLYTCRSLDPPFEQCLSVRVDIAPRPELQISPMSMTVEKGAKVQLICTVKNKLNLNIGIQWTNNNGLIKLEPGKIFWEDLYPSGSILKISKAQQSSVYTCSIFRSSASASIEVVNKTVIALCPRETLENLTWPETAPNSLAKMSCPKGFSGRAVTRQCSIVRGGESEWQVPDYSDCLHDGLKRVYGLFRELALGYTVSNITDIIQTFLDVMNRRQVPLYPGEGDRIFKILLELQEYCISVNETATLGSSIKLLLNIVNAVLKKENSIVKSENLLSIFLFVLRNLDFAKQKETQTPNRKHLVFSEMIADSWPLKLSSSVIAIPLINDIKKYPDWMKDKIRLHYSRSRITLNNQSLPYVHVVIYKDLKNFLPDTFVKEQKDGTDLEYQINSRIISVSSSKNAGAAHNSERFSVELQFGKIMRTGNNYNSQAHCGALEPNGDWNLETCAVLQSFTSRDSIEAAEEELEVDGIEAIHCRCSSGGTFAAFVSLKNDSILTIGKLNEADFVVIAGCSSCLIQCAVSAVVVCGLWWNNRTWLNFLKIQCCITTILTMGVFIYAILNPVSKGSWPLVALSLEIFITLSLASPIAIVLIIYTELTGIPANHQMQKIIVLLINGVSILTILMTEMTRKIVGWDHASWWLIIDTQVFNVFAICTILLVLTYFLLYFSVTKIIKPFIAKVQTRESIGFRVKTLHRTLLIIIGIVGMEVSSILYVNFLVSVYHYGFAFQSTLLGFIILSTYVLGADFSELHSTMHKLKNHRPRYSQEYSISDTMKSKGSFSNEERNDTREAISASSSTPEAFIHASSNNTNNNSSIAVGVDVRELSGESIFGPLPVLAAAPSSGPGLMTTILPPPPFYGINHSPEIQLHRIDNDTSIPLESYSLNGAASGIMGIKSTPSVIVGSDGEKKYESTCFSITSATSPAPEWSGVDCCYERDAQKYCQCPYLPQLSGDKTRNLVKSSIACCALRSSIPNIENLARAGPGGNESKLRNRAVSQNKSTGLPDVTLAIIGLEDQQHQQQQSRPGAVVGAHQAVRCSNKQRNKSPCCHQDAIVQTLSMPDIANHRRATS